MAKQKFTPQQVAEALRASKGMVYVAARTLGCSANTIYNYIERYKAVKEVMKQERGVMVDTAELALWTALQNKEAWAISLVLKTLGKDRGYIERQEHTGADGSPIAVISPQVFLPPVAPETDE